MPDDGLLWVDAFEQNGDMDIDAVDERVRFSVSNGVPTLSVDVSPAYASRACAVITRYQRYLDLRNEASADARFARILELHESIHDTSQPLVRADFEHAIDTWRWVVRMDRKATLACQIAALFHDVERLTSESERRVEHHALEYVQFKNLHAIHGAMITQSLLGDSGLPPEILRDVCQLVVHHEEPPEDPQAVLLADADALSFFSLNSPGFLDYFGRDHTLRKIAHTLVRMSRKARRRIASLWLRSDVRELVSRASGPDEGS